MSVKCHDTLDNANTRCLSDGFHAEVTGSQLLEIVSFGSAGHEPADDNENCMRSGKINVSQQVIDQQAILMKILLSSNNCTVVAWRCCPIWTCSTLFLILSSQQGKAQQTMSTCTPKSTYFACVLEEPICYCRQVLHQRASQAVSMYVFRHADSFTTGVEHPVAVNCKANRYMWRCAFP